MTLTRVFSGLGQGNQLILSDSFINPKAIYIVAPDTVDEIEIDFYLQFEITSSDNRLIPIEINNRYDTVRIFFIPSEYQDTNIPMHVTFSNTINETIEIWVITADSTIQSLSDQLTELQNLIVQDTVDEDNQALLNLVIDLIGAIISGNPALLLPSLPSLLPPFNNAPPALPQAGNSGNNNISINSFLGGFF